MLSARWEFDPDPTNASEVEGWLMCLVPARTGVEFEHCNLNVYDAQVPTIRKTVSKPGGWPGILQRLAATREAR